jgi:TolB protein
MSTRNGYFNIWKMDYDGSNPVQLTNDTAFKGGICWSPDGQFIAYGSDVTGNWDIWIIPANGGEAIQFTSDSANDIHQNWSSDGSRIAFSSNRSGNDDIWIKDVDLLETGKILNPHKVDISINPNPFNPSTTISFQLQTEITENVELLIYNLKGQKIISFSNHQIIQSPNHQINWNGTDQNSQPVSSGIYFAVLKQNGKILAKSKMMLLK